MLFNSVAYIIHDNYPLCTVAQVRWVNAEANATYATRHNALPLEAVILSTVCFCVCLRRFTVKRRHPV